MLIVHHLGISQSERVVWLCEELGVEYKLVKHTREPLLSPMSLKSVAGNATGKAPFFEDTSNGVQLSESAAITAYIAEVYGGGRFIVKSDQPKKYAEFAQWWHFANATLQPNMYTSMFLSQSSAKPDEGIVQFAEERLHSGFKVTDDRLAKHKWLAGDEFTIADIMSVYTLTTQRYWGPQVSLEGYDNILRWLKDCADRPGYRRAMEKGDPQMRLLINANAPNTTMTEAGGVNSDHWKK